MNWSQSSNNQNQTLISLSIIMKFLIHTLMDSFLSFGPLYIFFLAVYRRLLGVLNTNWTAARSIHGTGIPHIPIGFHFDLCVQMQ